MTDMDRLYAAIGRAAACGNLLDWMLAEICLAARGEHDLKSVAGSNTRQLLKDAKRAVQSDESIDDEARAQIREVLARVGATMTERGDAIHAAYVVDPATGEIMRMRLKRRMDMPLQDRVSPAFLEGIARELLGLVGDLGQALDQSYPDRAARPGSTFAPIRVEYLASEPGDSASAQ